MKKIFGDTCISEDMALYILELNNEVDKIRLKKYCIELVIKHYPNIECSDVISKAKDIYNFLQTDF